MRNLLLLGILSAMAAAFICFSTGEVMAFSPGASATPALAANGGFGVGVGIPDGNTVKKDFASYKDWVTTVYKFSLRLGAILTLLMLILSGYRYMTSQGNPTGINEAKEILFGSLSGFALLLMVYAILTFLGIPVS